MCQMLGQMLAMYYAAQGEDQKKEAFNGLIAEKLLGWCLAQGAAM